MSVSALDRGMNTIGAELFSKCFREYMECSDEVQQSIRDMINIAESPETSFEDRMMAIETIAEALFPGHVNGELGIDISEADEAAVKNYPDGRAALQELDDEEAEFADRLQAAMDKKNWNQSELANKSGVGQPAISMMLVRNCRPQKRTIAKLAAALGVPEKELWPWSD